MLTLRCFVLKKYLNLVAMTALLSIIRWIYDILFNY